MYFFYFCYTIIDMEDIVVRLNTQDADVITNDRKEFTFYFDNPIVLNDEYDLNVKELVCKDITPPAVNVVVLSDVSVVFNTNYGFDTTASGFYDFTDPIKGGIFVIEIYQPPGFTRQARITSVSNMGNYNAGDVINVPNSGANEPTPTAQNPLIFWNKTTASGELQISIDSVSGTTEYTEIGLNIKLDYVKFKDINYMNTGRIYTPYIVSHNPLAKIPLEQKYSTLNLVPQIIHSFKLIIDNEYELGLPENGIVQIGFILQKKYII